MKAALYKRPKGLRTVRDSILVEVPEMEPLQTPSIVAVSKKTECFVTPKTVIELMVAKSDIQEGMNILEPNAGTGAIVNYIKSLNSNHSVVCCEINHQLQRVLQEQGHLIICEDFLSLNFGNNPKWKFDRILMNPPFKNLADIDHVLKAYECLVDGGLLVAIMSPSPFFQTGNKAKAFRAWFEELGGEVKALPAESFKGSGTLVHAKLVVIEK